MVCLKETIERPLTSLCLFQATPLLTMTIPVLEGCLLAPAKLELDELENATSNRYK